MELPFNPKMTDEEFELYRKLWVLLRTENKNTFSCDDFRAFGLDRFIDDTQHGLGTLFAKMKHNKLIEDIGETRSQLASNHGRRIRLYRMKGLEIEQTTIQPQKPQRALPDVGPLFTRASDMPKARF